MRRSNKTGNHYDHSTYKQMVIDNFQSSVTSGAPAPAAQCRKLAPWLALANAGLGLGAEDFDTLVRRIRYFRAYAKEHPEDCADLAALVVAVLGYIAQYAECAGKSENPLTPLLELDYEKMRLKPPRLWVELRGDGRTETRFDYQVLDFQIALKGAEWRRIRRCPQCARDAMDTAGVRHSQKGRFFYAMRAVGQSAKDTSSKTCSPKCATALRTKRWREKSSEYHNNRKIAENEKAKSER
jgi:hypothetical protein